MDASAFPYPKKLQSIINLFESQPDEAARRDLLVDYSEHAAGCAPNSSEANTFDLEDVRKDEECTDTVGVYLKVLEPDNKAIFKFTLGPQVQTLTRAMAAILCKGLEGSTPQEILNLPSDFVKQIVGGELIRIRSQTVYYILSRLKGICKVWLQRSRS